MSHVSRRRCRLARRLVAALTVTLTMLTGTAAGARPTQAPVDDVDVPTEASSGARYLDQVFSEVEVTEDVKYTRQINVDGWEDLYLDLYEPVGDTSRRRPLVIWAHGGWFAFGDKAGGTSVEMGRELAKRGFVVASINYRLDPGNGWATYDSVDEAMANERFFLSVIRGTADIGNAAEYFRDNADQYRIHPDAIFAAGHSAGAVASLTQAYLPVHSDTTDRRLAAVASYAGMTYGWFAETGEPPAILFHGTADGTVPYSGAKALCDEIKPIIDCRLVSYPGGGHGISGDWEALREQTAAFFYDVTLSNLGFTTDVNPLDGASSFHLVTPTRLLDTRSGIGTAAAPVGPGSTRRLTVTGVAGVPTTGVSGIVANVTVTGGTAASHLTVWPGDEAQPSSSNVNWAAGTTRANLVTVKTGRDGTVQLGNQTGSVHVIVDVVGWLGPDPMGDRLHPVPPARTVDTRAGVGAPTSMLGPGAELTIDPTGTAGIPPTGVTGVIANITVTGGTAASHLTVWPGGPLPTASNLNWTRGQTIPNQVIAGLDVDGTFSIRNNTGSADVIVDVVGWLGAEPIGGRGCHLLSPTRVLDTRSGIGGPATPLDASSSRHVQLTGVAGIPDTGVGAVFTNTTATGGSTASHLTVWPAGTAMPTVSSLNWVAGETVPNHVVATPNDSGAIALANHAGTAQAVVDVTAWC